MRSVPLRLLNRRVHAISTRSFSRYYPLLKQNGVVFETLFERMDTVAEGHITENSLKLKDVFDKDTEWDKFNKRSLYNNHWGTKETGLFGNKELVNANGLLKFCDESLDKAKALVEQMISDNSPEGLMNYIRNLDKLSDTLCKVIDLSEFIRVAHPDQAYVLAAQRCHEKMFEFMNILNTNVELYEILNAILHDERYASQLSKEELAVGKLLLDDFSRSGIDMDPEIRDSFVQLNQEIAVLGSQFTNGVNEIKSNYIDITAAEYNTLDKDFQKKISKRISGGYKIPTSGVLPYQLLRSCDNEQVRRKVWLGLHTPPQHQIEKLNGFLKYRAYLANILNEPTFANYQLHDKLARNPENVKSFLYNLLQEVQGPVFKEIKLLYDYKQKYQLRKSNNSKTKNETLAPVEIATNDEIVDAIKPWDRDYLSTIHYLKQRSKNTETISSYLSVGTTMEGLSKIFESIWDIKLEPVQSRFGETWHNDVRKLHVISKTDGLIGIIYCDLFSRANKTTNPTHFTVVCSRRVYPDEEGYTDTSNDAVITTNTINDKLYQLPIISLVCDFSKNSNEPALLSLHQVETLFHEMGHAMHSMLGRTDLHNVSGTRCPTDFVEIPSILMEYFAKDERVLLRFARHYQTGEPLPLELLKRYQVENNFLKHSETYSQIKMALLDQVLHNISVTGETEIDSTDLYHHLEENLRVFADTESKWQAKFSHLFSYGSVYYSYLLDRAIAGKIWAHLFVDDPLSREAGEKLRLSLLKWGGSKNYWECLADVLDEPSLQKGDEKAMEFIGKSEI